MALHRVVTVTRRADVAHELLLLIKDAKTFLDCHRADEPMARAALRLLPMIRRPPENSYCENDTLFPAGAHFIEGAAAAF